MATITGTSGNDTLTGTSSDDTLVGSAGDDFYDGNAGFDTLDFRATATALMVDFTAGTLDGGFTGTFVDMERVLAGNGDDTLIGAAGGQNLSGRAGADVLEGRAGNDSLWGGGGDDMLVFRETGSANADDIGDFSSGSDKIVLDATVMTALGATGAFTTGDARFLSSTSGTAHDADDRVIYETDTRQIWYDPDGSGAAARQLIATLQSGATLVATDIVVEGEDTLPPGGATEGDDTLVGTEGPDSIDGLGGNDSISGLGGDDTLIGGAGADTMDGGAGDDTYFISRVELDTLVDSSGTDTIVSTDGASIWLPDGFENAIIRGGPTSAQITGNAANNLLIDESESGGEVFLHDEGGDDTLIGGAGFNFFSFAGDFGDDIVDGGDGINVLSMSGTDGVIVDFRSGTITGHPGGSIVFTNIDEARAGAGADQLIGDDTGVRLSGADGDDTVTGGAGDDHLWGDGGLVDFHDDVGDDLVSGHGGNDTLVGGPGADTLDGGAGDDTIRLNGSDDSFGTDVIDGGGGIDVVEIAGTNDVVVNLDSGILSGGGSAGDGASLANIENVSVSIALFGEPPFRAHITGAAGDNVLIGANGDDTLIGLDGLDTLVGGGGNDSIAGGEGWDSLTGGSGVDLFAFAEFGSGMNDDITDFVSGTDRIELDPAAFTTIGASGAFSSGDGRFWAAPGASGAHDADDRIIYDTASGILYYDADGDGPGAQGRVAILEGAPALVATDIVVKGEDTSPGGATEGDDTLVGTGGPDTIDGLGGNDSISGLGGDDHLIGGTGQDTLDGGAGADTLEGGAGDDTYIIDSEDVYSDTGGVDTVFSNDGHKLVDGSGVENLVINSTSTWLIGEGNELDNVITNASGVYSEGYLNGGGGNDTLVGGPHFVFYGQSFSGDYGHDFVDGAGDDGTMYFEDHSAVVVDFSTGTVIGGGTSGTGRVDFVDIRRVVGSAFDDQFIASDSGSIAFGGAGNDTFIGGAGDDIFSDDGILVYDGASIHSIAEGNDDLTGGAGDDLFSVNRGDDTVDAGDGNDAIHIDIDFYNSSYSYGNDTLDGGSGIDTLSIIATTAVSVDLGAGTMTGGGVDGSGSAVLTGIENFDTSRGFGGDHHLVGSAVGNVLTTRSGDDTINGAGGSDTLTGGSGADVYEFDQAPGEANADLITDMSFGGVDLLRLHKSAMPALGAEGRMADGDPRFHVGSSAADADDRLIYDGNSLYYDPDGSGPVAQLRIVTVGSGGPGLQPIDIEIFGDDAGGEHIVGTEGDDSLLGTTGDDAIDGLGGDDYLDGAPGDDRLDGGAGNDEIEGSGGHDTLLGGADDDLLAGGSGNDQIIGGDGNDVLDFLPFERGGDDTLDGGAGNDTFFAMSGDVLLDSGGIDTVITNESWTLASGFENLEFDNFDFADEGLPGLEGYGNELANRMQTYGGDSGLLDGRDGDDTLIGGVRGDDALFGSAGNDLLTGDGGADRFMFTVAPGPLNADRITDFISASDKLVLDGNVHAQSGPSGGLAAGDERFAANATGSAEDSSDRVVYDTSTGDLWYDADGSGTGAAALIATLDGAPALAATDIEVINGTSGTPGENIVGTPGSDTLQGGAGDDTLNGLGGSDVLVGSGGSDFYDGGAGSDTLDFRAAATGLAVSFAAGTVSGAFAGTFAGIERVLGGDFADELIGGSGGQNLSGRGGADTLEGGVGNDWLWGGGGNDMLVFRETGTANDDDIGDFSSGSDKIVLDATVMTALGAEGNFAAGDARFAANTSGTAQDGSDRVIYETDTRQIWYDPDGNGASARQLIATLQSGATLVATDIVVEGGGTPPGGATEGDDSIVGTAGDDTIDGLGGNDLLIGNEGADVIRGGEGNDTLWAGEADGFAVEDFVADTLDGGFGDDEYHVYGGDGDTILDDPGGIDTVFAWHSSWTLGPGLENLILADNLGVGSSGTGNELDNLIVSATEGGTLLGLGGNDTLSVHNAENTVTARGGDGDDTLIGGHNSDDLFGDAGNDLLVSNDGFGSLTGGEGEDVFFFNTDAVNDDDGERITDFASGVDTIRLDAAVMPALGTSGRLAPGDSRFAADSTGTAQDSADRIIYSTLTGELWYDADGSGTGAAALIATLENAPAFTATDIEVINGTSGTPGESIVGTSGSDTLQGGPGDDTLSGLGGNDVLVGSEGSDFYDGGAGSDTLDFRAASTSVAVDFGVGTLSGGFDGTFAGIERVLAGNGNDVLTGTAGAQNLSGRAGSDTLAGGGGNDWLWGGGDDDTFIFRETGAANEDDIGDFSAGADTIALDNAVMAALGAEGAFGAGDDRFFFGAGASGGADAEDRVVYNTTTGALYYDADGSGAGGAELIATLQGAPGLAATDISVI